MNEIPHSDWTLAAFKQREEERRKKEQDEKTFARPDADIQHNNETLRCDLTIAALQKRFAALEQRLAALEQREEERLGKVRAEAAPIQPQEEMLGGKEMLLSNSTLVAPKQRDMEGRTNEAAEFSDAKMEDEQVEAPRHATELQLQREEAKTVRCGDREKLQINRMEIRPIRNGDTVRGGTAHTIVRGVWTFIVTASIAGAIGFGIGAYVAPIEKANHFRALVKRGADSLYGGRAAQEN
jgi:hypothetical protein